MNDAHLAAKIRELWSVLDKHFSQIRGAVLAWRIANQVPEELQPYFERVAERQSREGVLRLLDAWQEHRIGGDHEIFEQLLGWRNKHIHL